jgi:hypothetical protein
VSILTVKLSALSLRLFGEDLTQGDPKKTADARLKDPIADADTGAQADDADDMEKLIKREFGA